MEALRRLTSAQLRQRAGDCPAHTFEAYLDLLADAEDHALRSAVAEARASLLADGALTFFSSNALPKPNRPCPRATSEIVEHHVLVNRGRPRDDGA